MENKKNVLSLFSGCGGLDLGFEGGFKALKRTINTQKHPDWVEKEIDENWVKLKSTQFKTIFSNDILRSAEAAWVPYFNKFDVINNTFHRGSIVNYVKQAKNGADFEFPSNIDVVTGGFPCQDFSVAGNRNGFKSDKSHTGELLEKTEPSIESRGKLYMWMREVIELTKPKVFVAENVKGLVSLSNVKEIIENDFRNIGEDGYLVVEAKVLNAAEYGVPQNRERVIFIGFSIEHLKNEIIEKIGGGKRLPAELDPYPPRTHYLKEEDKEDDLVPFVKTKEILTGLKEPENSEDPAHRTYSGAKFMGSHCQGQTEVDLNGLSPTIRAEHHGNIEFRRLAKDHGGKYIEELENGMKERRLSVRECARIQTFPDDFQFVRNPRKRSGEHRLSGSAAYKLIGNAVPPILGYNIAMRLEHLWNKLFD
ncbi:MAG TPA: DNA (cytosine-5-)-methyltransferase [Balneolaceae bacterium]